MRRLGCPRRSARSGSTARYGPRTARAGHAVHYPPRSARRRGARPGSGLRCGEHQSGSALGLLGPRARLAHGSKYSASAPLRRPCRAPGSAQSGHPGACVLLSEEQLVNVSPLRARTWDLDQACAEAVGLARSAAEELVGSAQVGQHLGAAAEGDRLVTHLFACLDPAYAGWRWAVTVARASRAQLVDPKSTRL